MPRLADLYAELGTDYELSLDLYDPAARLPVLDVAAAAGATDRLWVCAGEGLGRSPNSASANMGVHLVLYVNGSGSPDRWNVMRRVSAEEGIAAVNMHFTDWTKGLVELYHRFDVLAFAWDIQQVRHLCGLAQWEWTRCIPTTWIEWWRPSPSGATEADPVTGSRDGRAARCAQTRGRRCSSP